MQVKRLTGPDAACVVIDDKPTEKRKVGGSTPPLTTHQTPAKMPASPAATSLRHLPSSWPVSAGLVLSRQLMPSGSCTYVARRGVHFVPKPDPPSGVLSR